MKIESFGSAVKGVTIRGNKNDPEVESFRVMFPGGIVDVTRATDTDKPDYWVHVICNNPQHGMFIEGEDEQDNAIPIIGERYLEVARVQPRAFYEDTQTANARLIAAAPEMLAALEAALKCLTMDSDMEEDFAPEIKQMRDVIAKAKGEGQ